MLALTHVPSPRLAECQRTYVAPAPIDHARAAQQHEAYCGMLRRCGAEVRTLSVNHASPDCAFIEDTAVVLDELALLGSMGTASRCGEPAGIETELRRYRPVHRIEPPATLEGGDVLRVGRTLLVGLSSRTSAAGAAALEQVVAGCGYRVVLLQVLGCLHLKTACTALDDETLLVNPTWVDVENLRGFRLVRVPDNEPWAANVLRLRSTLCVSAAHVRTAGVISEMGYETATVDLSEFAKAEGGITCLSLPVG